MLTVTFATFATFATLTFSIHLRIQIVYDAYFIGDSQRSNLTAEQSNSEAVRQRSGLFLGRKIRENVVLFAYMGKKW